MENIFKFTSGGVGAIGIAVGRAKFDLSCRID